MGSIKVSSQNKKEYKMFSVKQKQKISEEIEKLLLKFDHPEMPKEKVNFKLHVDGIEDWSWADISPNWYYNDETPPSINPFNERMETADEN